MLPPRTWLWSLGFLAVAPVAALAGPLDFLRPNAESAQSTADRSNQQVAEEIAGALRTARLVGRDIDIEFKNGVAVLTGQIADEAQRAAATRVTAGVQGVRSVENRLTLMSGAPRAVSSSPVQQAGFEGDGRRPKVQQIQYAEGDFGGGGFGPEPLFSSPGYPATTPAGASNQETAQQVATAVQEAGLQNYDLEIRFVDGTCTLRGAVDNRNQAVAASQAAARVPGVKKVVNQMTVRGNPVSVASPESAPGEPVAMYRPYPSAQAAQLAWQQQNGQGQMAGGGYPNPHQGGVRPVSGMQPGGPSTVSTVPPGYAPPGYAPGPMMGPQGYAAAPGGYPPPGPYQMYNRPNLPDYAWPAYAPYDNYAAVTYPSQYEASAWPYIGPFYPYPQVPLEWRSAQLVWDDGFWNLKFNSRTDKWWWFLFPENWH